MQGSLLRGRAIKTSQAYVKNSTSDSTMANLNSMFNPLAAIASNPFLMGLGGLTGLGGQPQGQMQGMPAMQGYQGYPGAMGAMGGMPGMDPMAAMTQGYGMYQQGYMGQQPSMQMPMMQGYGYGAASGYDMNQGIK